MGPVRKCDLGTRLFLGYKEYLNRSAKGERFYCWPSSAGGSFCRLDCLLCPGSSGTLQVLRILQGMPIRV